MNGTYAEPCHKVERVPNTPSPVKRVPVDRHDQWSYTTPIPASTIESLAPLAPLSSTISSRTYCAVPSRTHGTSNAIPNSLRHTPIRNQQQTSHYMHTVEQQRSCFGSPRVLLYPDFCDLNQLSPSASMDAFGIDSMEGPESGDDLDKPSHPSSVALMLKRFQPGHVQGVKGDPCSVWGTGLTSSIHGQFKDQVRLNGPIWFKEGAKWQMLHGMLILDKMQAEVRLELYRNDKDSRLVRVHDLTGLQVCECPIEHTQDLEMFPFELAESNTHHNLNPAVCLFAQNTDAERSKWISAYKEALSLAETISSAHICTSSSTAIPPHRFKARVDNEAGAQSKSPVSHNLSHSILHLDEVTAGGLVESAVSIPKESAQQNGQSQLDNVTESLDQTVKLLNHLESRIQSIYSTMDKTLAVKEKHHEAEKLDSAGKLDEILGQLSKNSTCIATASELILGNIGHAQSKFDDASNALILEVKQSATTINSEWRKRLVDLQEQQKIVAAALANFETFVPSLKSAEQYRDARLDEAVNSMEKLIQNMPLATTTISDLIQETKTSILAILSDINSKLNTTATSRSVYSGSTFTGNASDGMIDRPTKTLMISMNEKLIQLQKMYEHSQQSILSRFSSLEERLIRSVTASHAESSGSLSSTYHLEKAVKEIKTDVADTTERLSRISRDHNEHMSSTSSTLQKILDRIDDVLEKPACISCEKSSRTSGTHSRHQSDDRIMEARFSEIQETLRKDSKNTSDRITQMLTMFSIQQEVLTKLSSDVSTLKTSTLDSAEQFKKDSMPSTQDDMIKNMVAINAKVDQLTTMVQHHNSLQVLIPDTTGQNALTKIDSNILQSIHTTLVNYLPLNLEQKLATIEANMDKLRQSCNQTSNNNSNMYLHSQGLQHDHLSKSHISTHVIVEWQRDIMARNNGILQALDAVQQSLSRVVENVCKPCVNPMDISSRRLDGNGGNQGLQVVSLDSNSKVISLLHEIKTIAMEAAKCGPIRSPPIDTSKANEMAKEQFEELVSQVKKLEKQKQMLNAEIIVLKGSRR
ncbi:hypothetical protein MT418_004954 [Batrachochytrium dendrobatidis]